MILTYECATRFRRLFTYARRYVAPSVIALIRSAAPGTGKSARTTFTVTASAEVAACPSIHAEDASSLFTASLTIPPTRLAVSVEVAGKPEIATVWATWFGLAATAFRLARIWCWIREE